MYFKLPTLTSEVGISFTIDNQSFRLSPVRKIKRGEYYQFVTDIFWDERVIYGLVLHGGVNIVRQYGFCPLPSLYALRNSGVPDDSDTFEELYSLYTED